MVIGGGSAFGLAENSRQPRAAAAAAASVVQAPKRKQTIPMGVDVLNPQIVNAIARNENPSRENLHTVYGMNLDVVHPSRNSADECKSMQKWNPNSFGGLGYKPRKKTKEDGFESEIARSEQAPFGGLKNLGATCYMNSMLQCLYHNKRFRNGVFELARPGAMSDEVRKNELDEVIFHTQRLRNCACKLFLHPRLAIGQRKSALAF